MSFFRIVSVIALCALPAFAAEPKEDLAVLTRWPRYQQSQHTAYNTLVDEAIARLAQRETEVAALHTASQWADRREAVVNRMTDDLLGPMPEKTPLRARVTGVVLRPGYRIEKVIYESVPGCFVPAALFVPDPLPAPTAAIVFASGHTADAWRNATEGATYLQIIVNLVRKGFVVFAFDPWSQGERVQFFDGARGVSRLGKASAQHNHMGLPVQLTRTSLAASMTWDGIRAIDYVASRPEVDAGRIGLCGSSGGGTQTAYIAAVDPRVRAAAPANFITSWRRLLQTRGPQDAEQYLDRQIAHGIDHADYLLARAPRPTLLAATTRDFFSIQGTRETYAEARRAYAALGAPGAIELAEDDFEHGYTRRTREAMYAFFQKHLGVRGSPAEEAVEVPAAADLRVTDSGQVATSLGGETFFSLTQAAAAPLLAALERSRRNLPAHLTRVVSRARGMSGWDAPQRRDEPVFAGRYQRDGYAVEKWLLDAGGGWPVPYLVFAPMGDGVRHPAVVYLHPKGKAAEAARGGEMERLARAGHVVLAPDLVGLGETAPSADIWEMAMLLGRSQAGLRAAEIARLVQVLRARDGVDPARITGVSRGELGVELLHAAVFEPALARVALVDPLLSYRALISEEVYEPAYAAGIVARALMHYDLPDLAASLAPRPLAILNPRNGAGARASAEIAARDLAVVRGAYAGAASGALTVLESVAAPAAAEALLAWLR